MAQNDYYALMQMLQAPALQKKQREQAAIQQIMTNIGQTVYKRKIKKDIEAKIAEAEKTGKKVEYKIDPQTGQITPVISSAPSIFDVMKEHPEILKDYEIDWSGKTGKPGLKKKKEISTQEITAAKNILSGDFGSAGLMDTTIAKIRNPMTGEAEDVDLSTEEGVNKAIDYKWGADWRNKQELIDADIPDLFDKRITEIQTKKATVETAKAGKEPRVQPFAKGLGRIGGIGAEYKEAAVKYGEPKTKRIVDTIIQLQGQGKSLTQIRKMLEEAGADADVFLKPYGK